MKTFQDFLTEAKEPKKNAAWFEDNIIGVDKCKISKGVITFYHGFYYMREEDQNKWIQSIKDQTKELGITLSNVKTGVENSKKFKGGATVDKQNHYWISFTM